jgi:hypothetical protein
MIWGQGRAGGGRMGREGMCEGSEVRGRDRGEKKAVKERGMRKLTVKKPSSAFIAETPIA